MKKKRLKALIPFITIFFIVTAISFYTAPRAEAAKKRSKDKSSFSGKAKRKFKAGMKAAKKEDWALAIKNFNEARELAPHESRCLLNLALAHDKVGGQSVRAVAWYYAYLESAPGADNAGSVRARIDALKRQVRGELAKMLKMAENALPAVEEYYKDGDPKFFPGPYSEIGSASYEIDVKAANEMGDSSRKFTYSTLGAAQASVGKFDAAMLTADRILTCERAKEYKEKREILYMWIAYYMAVYGHVDDALALAEKELVDPEARVAFYGLIAEMEFDRGNRDLADKLVTKIWAYFDAGQIENEGEAYGFFEILLHMKRPDDAERIRGFIEDEGYRKGTKKKLKAAISSGFKKNKIDDWSHYAYYGLWNEFHEDLYGYIEKSMKKDPSGIVMNVSSAVEILSVNLLKMEMLENRVE